MTVVDYLDVCIYIDGKKYIYVSQHDLENLTKIYFNLLTEGLEKTEFFELDGLNYGFFDFFESQGGFPENLDILMGWVNEYHAKV